MPSEAAPESTGAVPGLELGRLAGSQILIQYEGASRRQPHVIRSKPEAVELATELKKRLDAGDDFAELAREYSDDLVTGREGGDLGVFEPGDQIRRVSNTLQKMQFGEIRGPLSSRFGFHILRRDRVELFGARQILIQHVESRKAAEGVERTRDEARALVEELHGRLLAGEDFAELARQFSDAPEAEAGGELPPFARGEMVKPFEEAVRATQLGAFSAPVESIYGFHLIERTR